eukprot:7346923-Alexandrium_andersonii.AAC.1
MSKFTHRLLSKHTLQCAPVLKAKARSCLHVNAWLLEVASADTSSPHLEYRASVHWGYNVLFETFKAGEFLLNESERSQVDVACNV